MTVRPACRYTKLTERDAVSGVRKTVSLTQGHREKEGTEGRRDTGAQGEYFVPSSILSPPSLPRCHQQAGFASGPP